MRHFGRWTVSSPIEAGGLLFGSNGSGAYANNYIVAIKPGKDASLAYAASVSSGPTSVLLVADENDGIDYSAVNDGLAQSYAGASVLRSDIDRQGLAAARATLLDGLGAGATITSYLGHSGPREWGPAGFFASRDVAGPPPRHLLHTYAGPVAQHPRPPMPHPPRPHKPAALVRT